MSRFDVLRSLVRSAGDKLDTRALRAKLAQKLADAALARIEVSDVELTGAVARGRNVSAATVTTDHEGIAIEVSLDDGRSVGLTLVPATIRFAPGGAKEVGFHARPSDVLDQDAAREAFAAVAGVLGEALWRPAFGGLPPRGEPSAFVTRDDDHLVLDLRTVPSIREVSRNRLGLAILEALVLKSIETRPGGVRLAIGVRGMG